MTGLTLRTLLTADPATYRAAAAAWGDLASALADRADALAAPANRLPEVWQGPAGTAAAAHCSGLRDELELGYVPVLSIAQALSHFADSIEHLRAQAEALVASGAQLHVTVRPDGSMSLDQGYQDEWTARSMSSLGYQRDELLAAAAALDAQTARTIGENTASAAGIPAAAVDRASVPAKGTDPQRVRAWWDSLSPAQRRWVLATYPGLVGNLDGVPVAARDVANRIVLDRVHDLLVERRSRLDARDADRAEIDRKLRGIDKISQRLDDDGSGRPHAYLIGFSSTGDGKAIVAMGNPDEADNVVTYVPGTGSELSKMGGDMERADRMASDAALKDPGASTAAIVWLGYDAPDTVPDAIADRSAEGGAGDLRRFQSGLRATHDGAASHNVVLGHSYGTTVIGQTASEAAGLDADDVIFVASPGVEVSSAEGLHINGDPTKSVWSTTAKNDPIQASGLDDNLIHGENPSNPGFGARIFTSAAGTPTWDWHDPLAVSAAAHSEYWDRGNVARDNIAYIVTGQYGEVR